MFAWHMAEVISVHCLTSLVKHGPIYSHLPVVQEEFFELEEEYPGSAGS